MAMKILTDLGAWIVAIYKVLSRYNVDDPALDELESIIMGGRAAEFFSSVRSLGSIENKLYDTHRKLAGLRPSAARKVVEAAANRGFVTVQWTDESPPLVKRFEFNTDSNVEVLRATGDIFETLDPTPVARAVIEILRTTLLAPRRLDDTKSTVIATGLSESSVNQAIELVCALKLINRTRETEAGSHLLFNPHVFANDAVDVVRTLNSLNPSDRQHAQDILTHIHQQPGVPLPERTDQRILQVLIKVGLVDYSKITTGTSKHGVYFATRPQIWGVLAQTGGPPLSKDLIDDSKLFLNSLRYGEFYSDPTRGKIINPYWIVNALLRDGAIGIEKPVRAIGEDYPLVWSRGIINVVESRIYPGRYSMELLKADVASAVRDVLSAQKILPSPKTHTAEEVERAGRFVSPGAVRVERELPPELRKYHDELVFGLRTMRKRR